MFLNQLTQAIGNTPLLAATRFMPEARFFVKCEGCNPGGSVKDRAALAMIEDGEARGLLHPGGIIIEPTSGNTGIGLALVAAQKGYRLILTMPESMSTERRKLLQAMGAELILTPAQDGMQGAVTRAQDLAAQYTNSFIPDQFSNPANAYAHYTGTAQEIWTDLAGQVDVLIAGVGSGGTITGCGRRLKELNPHIYIVAIEPADSPLLSQGKAGTHAIQGIGANFIPKLLDQSILDEIVPIRTVDAISTARRFSRQEGITVGISSGAALQGALFVAAKKEFAKKNIVIILPDGGERYLSTELFT